MILYGAVKFVAYVTWCYLGIKWLSDEATPFPLAVGLGTLRWFLGLVLGFILFFTVPVSSQEEAGQTYFFRVFAGAGGRMGHHCSGHRGENQGKKEFSPATGSDLDFFGNSAFIWDRPAVSGWNGRAFLSWSLFVFPTNLGLERGAIGFIARLPFSSTYFGEPISSFQAR